MVECPTGRVVENVLPDPVQGFFITDDVFVIITLPCEIRDARVPNQPRRYRLVHAYYISQRRGVIHHARIRRPKTIRGHNELCPYIRWRGLWGRNELRPYNDDAVNVIGHDDEPIQAHRWKPCRQFIPRRLRDLTGIV